MEQKAIARTSVQVKELRDGKMTREDAVAFFSALDSLFSHSGRVAFFRQGGLEALMGSNAEKKALEAGCVIYFQSHTFLSLSV